MENNQKKLLYEIIEHSQIVEKLIISSELAMNDGDLAQCQKNVKEASNFLKTMSQDVFREFFGLFDVTVQDVNPYDIPSGLEVCKSISNLCYNISVLLGLDNDNQSGTLTQNQLNKIAKDINTILELYKAIYAN